MKTQPEATTCSQCGKRCETTRIHIIDGKPVCQTCLFDDLEPVIIFPIGHVINNLQRDKTGFGTCGQEGVSEIRLLPSQQRFLFKLEEESHLTVIYHLHESGAIRSRFNRRYDGKEVGVFASRTPNRLSRLAIQDVRLVRIEGISIFVEGLDAINGSPVLDIKMKWSANP